MEKRAVKRTIRNTSHGGGIPNDSFLPLDEILQLMRNYFYMGTEQERKEMLNLTELPLYIAPREDGRLVLPRIRKAPQNATASSQPAVAGVTKHHERREQQKQKNERSLHDGSRRREKSARKDADHRPSDIQSTGTAQKTGARTNPQHDTKLPPLGKLPGSSTTHTAEKTKTKCHSEMQTKSCHKQKHVSSNQTLPIINDRRRLPTIRGRRDKVPEIKVVDWDKEVETKRKHTKMDETGSDVSSNLAKHHDTATGQSRSLKRRDSFHKSREHLMSLMPSKNAKRYQFPNGAVSGAQQELNRMRKLMGRENVAREKSHVDAIIGESRKRAARLNAMMSGHTNTHNTTTNNNIRVPSNTHARTSGSDVICKSPVDVDVDRRGQGGHQQRKRRLPMMSVILSNHEKQIPNAVLAFLNVFRQPTPADTSSRLGHSENVTLSCSNKSLVLPRRQGGSATNNAKESRSNHGYQSPNG